MPSNRFSNINKKLCSRKCEVIQFVPRAARYATNARRSVDGLTVVVRRGAEVITQLAVGTTATGDSFPPTSEHKHAVLDALYIVSAYITDPKGDDSAS